VKLRIWFWFIFLEAATCLFVFRDGLWGGSILAPVDIAPALFSKYKFVDPNSSGVPANHYTIDQLLADLPLQHTMYQAYRRGQVPWWDPYTYSGMPMIADGHASGTDFSRLVLYQFLGFVPAYNWARILHFILLGTGMLLLLLRLRIPPWIAVTSGITFQFAGFFALGFQHPWLESSFLYYPFLWVAWDAYHRRPLFRYIVIASGLAAAICYSGSIQTQTYLPIFGAAFLFGYGGLNGAELRKIAPVILISGAVGACLAAPILFDQAELFFLSARKVAIRTPLTLLSGFGSLTAFYPWCLGTFRTLDLGKFIEQNSLGFNLFIGTAGAILAVFGTFWSGSDPEASRAKRTSVILIGTYLLIMSTPLLNFFYSRCAGLPVMGMVILMSIALKALARSTIAFRRLGWSVLVLAILIAAATNLAAKIVYPRYAEDVRNLVNRRDKANAALDRAPALRDFQTRNLPHEISFENPEVLIGWLALVAVSVGLLRPELRASRTFWFGLVILNMVPVLSFARRYIPRSDLVLWQRLLEGGPEQKRVMKQCGHSPERLTEVAPGMHDLLFPGAMSHLFGIRVTHGYTGLVPRSLLILSPAHPEYRPFLGDWVYESRERGDQSGLFERRTGSGLTRFQWLGAAPRRFAIRDIGLNVVEVSVEAGESGKLLRTDTYYPGWRAEGGDGKMPILFEMPCFSVLEVPSTATKIVLSYRPRFLNTALAVLCCGPLILALFAIGAKVKLKSALPVPVNRECETA
jgi:hypothetical protein